MSASNRQTRTGGVDAETKLLWAALVTFTVVVGTLTAAVHLAARLDGRGQRLPANPVELVLGLARGRVEVPTSTVPVLAALVALLAIVAAVVGVLVYRRGRRRSRVDPAAARMGAGRDLAALTERGAGQTARRLGVTEAVGLPIARTVAGDRLLYQGWEDVSVDVWGPRTGKSTSRAIPAILAAPGAVLATSNKRDLVDATRGPRAAAGASVWVFDPQGLADEPPTWWWNPLSYVTDEVRASILADVFAAASRDVTARTDAYFDTAAQDLLAGLLLAAATADRPITQVYLWLTDPTDDEPVDILRPQYPLSAAAVAGVVNAPEKQRGGVYGTAQQIASFLTNRAAVRWVVPPAAGEQRPEFDPAAFVAGQGTLFSLSKEGRGSCGPLVTALTVAVTEAAEDLAKRSPGGRLRVPLVAVLDEAANVCRWRELPNLYSHYGSRGIVIMTILQSWSQGVDVWGREGMRKLWSAANIKTYGGGVSEAEFLGELSSLIGDHDVVSTSVSHGKGGRSTSTSTRRERVLDVADLAAMPKGRAVLFASGAPPTLVRTLPWMAGPHAAAVRASIAAHDPAAADTLSEAAASLADTRAAATAREAVA